MVQVMEGDSGYLVQKISDEKGIGVFATKPFKKGDAIFEERPIVSSQFAWNKEYKYSACDHCMRPLESSQENIIRLTQNPSAVVPFPEVCPTDKLAHVCCPQCNVVYCCDECQRLAWNQYHKMLCEMREPLTALYNAWMNIHYPPETTSIELLVRIIASIEQSSNKEDTFQELMQFCHESESCTAEVALRLLGEKGMHNLAVLQPLLLHGLPTTLTAPLVSVEGLKSFFSLVGRNGQGVGTSVFSEWVRRASALTLAPPDKERLDNFIDTTYKEMDRVVGIFLNSEGSGLYKLQRCLNHSCVPNAEVAFPHSNHVLRLVATSDIAPGDEISISYLDECALTRSRHSRNKILRDYYLFECKCSKCFIDMMEEVDETSEDEDEMNSDDDEDDND